MSKKTTIEWHPLHLVPYDAAKHDELYEGCDEKPEFVWEGHFPERSGFYLVTLEGREGKLYTDLDEFDEAYLSFVISDDDIRAWAELPEPYKPTP